MDFYTIFQIKICLNAFVLNYIRYVIKKLFRIKKENNKTKIF